MFYNMLYKGNCFQLECISSEGGTEPLITIFHLLGTIIFVLGSQWRTIISNWIDRQIANWFSTPNHIHTLLQGKKSFNGKTCFNGNTCLNGRLVSNYQAVATPHKCCGRCNGRNLKCLLFRLHCSGQEEIRPTLESKFVDSTLALWASFCVRL